VRVLPDTVPIVVPGKLTLVTLTLSVETTVQVTVLLCEEVNKLTTLPSLLLEKDEIVGLILSSVLIVIVFDLLVVLPAASVTTTLTVSLFVEFGVKSL